MTWAAASGYIDYTVDFLIKDNRFKVIIGPFSHVSTHYKWGDQWSNGLLYKGEPNDELFETLGIKKIARKQYREIDKRVKPLTKTEIETIMYSLLNKLDNDANRTIKTGISNENSLYLIIYSKLIPKSLAGFGILFYLCPRKTNDA